jgi:hypothetical protein
MVVPVRVVGFAMVVVCERLRPARQQEVAVRLAVRMAVDVASVPVADDGGGVAHVRNRSQAIRLHGPSAPWSARMAASAFTMVRECT